MVYTDQTSSFQSLISEGSSRSASPSGRDSRSRDRKGKGKGKGKQDDEVFIQEAYRIHVHLASLTTLVQTIRKPYLSLTEPPLSRRHHRPTHTLNGDGDGEGKDEDGDSLGRWKGSTYLTDRERDEIDLRGRMILRRCKERLGDLERSERARQITKAPLSRLQTLLPSLAPQADRFEPLIKAHRSSILWTLNDRLAKASSSLTDLQEERSRRREERGRSLGGQAAKEAARLGVGVGVGVGSTKPSNTGWSLNGLLSPSQPGPGSSSNSNYTGLDSQVIPSNEPSIESQLSASQLQALESENSALLENMESTLSSVLSAEKSLLEISALQTELVKNLVQQTELTDRLYEEAVGSVGEMKKAGQQLEQAKKRGEEGRMFLLIFLFGASMALLFLDWYAS